MASSYIPAPGTPFGPCNWTCAHKDCAELRMMAASSCRLCQTAITFERHYYRDPQDDGAYVHAVCLEETVKA